MVEGGDPVVQAEIEDWCKAAQVRRRFRELYRHHLADIKPGMDLLMVARVRAADMPFGKLEKQYLSCLDQLGLLRGQ